jgi:hypothetical protein
MDFMYCIGLTIIIDMSTVFDHMYGCMHYVSCEKYQRGLTEPKKRVF